MKSYEVHLTPNAIQDLIDIYEYLGVVNKFRTPADVFYNRGQSILNEREKIKQRTLALRRQMFYANQT